ncbi:MAG TPA: hypothetical protein PK530_00345 [Anaerolineales bacterium]|nr:hypothetical protein [Anaerolineales bacterium]
MPVLIGIPILALALIFQSAILSHVMLLSASADLVLVVVVSWMMQERVKAMWEWGVIATVLVGFVSEFPMWGYLIGYAVVVVLGILLKRRVWRAPLLALFTMVFIGTLVMQSVVFVVLRLLGTAIDPLQAFNQIILPSVLLNLLLAIPVNGLMREVAAWFYPDEGED